jgi:hypothetical protein
VQKRLLQRESNATSHKLDIFRILLAQKLNAESRHFNFVLIVVSQEYFEKTVYNPVRKNVNFPNATNFEIDVLIDYTFFSLEQRINVETLKFLFQKILLEILVESLSKVLLRPICQEILW